MRVGTTHRPLGGTACAARSRLRADERGEITSTTLVFPALLFVILVAVQFALAYHAKTVVTAAAQDGTRSAQAEGASPADGRAVAEAFVAENASRLLDQVVVTVDADRDHVRVEVAGRVATVVPGLNLRVRGAASGPTERFVPAVER